VVKNIKNAVKNNMNTLSNIQSKRQKNGIKYENYIINKYGLTPAIHENGLLDIVGKTYHVDAFHKNMMIEICTSAKDGKEAKVRLESKCFKEEFPNKYFVVLIKKISNPRLDGFNSYYDHLVLDPNIDKVLVGEDEFKKHLKKPSYEKIKINKQQGDNMNIIDQIIAKGFDIGTPDAARFLRVFVETNGDFKSSTIKKTGESPYQATKKKAECNVNDIKTKDFSVVDDSDINMTPLLEKMKEWGYSDTSATKPKTILGGRVGHALANGVELGFNTDKPSFNNLKQLLHELYVPSNMKNPKDNKY